MEEYVEDELADGKDDDKRIQRADFRVGRELKTAKVAKSKKFPIRKRGQNVNASRLSVLACVYLR